MSVYNLRQVKKEIRVLGVAARPAGVDYRIQVVGVVFRGKLWLDGVMRTETIGPDVTKGVAKMICNSPHHPQIRVILLHGDLLVGGTSINPCILSSATLRPVIALNFNRESIRDEGIENVRWLRLEQKGLATSSFSVGLTTRIAMRVLETAKRGDAMPEALRVARLVASAFAEGALT